ncbi:hypothetical protein, partial [Colwellia echini]|uniref:hypothetical protein n=1 Tax=Colwellia echini TaxID=1982103 RepID=UPI00147816A0
IDAGSGGTNKDIFEFTGTGQTFTVSSLPTSFELLKDGGSGNSLKGSEGVDNTFTLSDVDKGNLSDSTSTINFIGFTTLVGGAGTGDNSFVITHEADGSIELQGAGTGSNTVSTTGDFNRTWLVDANNKGSVEGYTFTGVDHLVGGVGTDSFTVNSGVSIGTI